MIRFVYIGGQIMSGNKDFAFWDTVTDKFVTIYDTSVFHSLDDLKEALHASDSSRQHLLMWENIEFKKRFTEKVWEPHSGHIVERLDSLVKEVESREDLTFGLIYDVDSIRDFIVRLEIELGMCLAATPLTT